MAVNINSFKLFVEFVSNKVQIGQSVSVSQFNELANRAQMQVFEKDFETFIRLNQTSEFLKTFLKNIPTGVPSTGIYNLPSDFQHMAAVRKYYVPPSGGIGKMIPVGDLTEEEYGEAQISALLTPTLRFPKYNEFGNTLRFLPRTIGLIEFDYFRTPVAPIWAFTTTNNRPVYNPVASVNFEFGEFAENAVCAQYLSLIGINLREQELGTFANQYKQETNSIL